MFSRLRLPSRDAVKQTPYRHRKSRHRAEIVYKVAHERGGPQTLSPITFVLLRAASGPLDELQAAASGMPVGKQDLFLIVAEIGDILARGRRWRRRPDPDAEPAWPIAESRAAGSGGARQRRRHNGVDQPHEIAKDDELRFFVIFIACVFNGLEVCCKGECG